ncbi:S40A1 protein, partial [Polyodon spathula]|nr:S40A1 protein [Polyodon spathula]
MNVTMKRIDQATNILAPLAVGQVMTEVAGCGFILGWNLPSLMVEFIFLSRVYKIVPALSMNPSLKSDLRVAEVPEFTEENCHISLHLKDITHLPLRLRKLTWLLSTCKDGWKAYYRQSVLLAGMGLAFLYTTVLGFDCITTGPLHLNMLFHWIPYSSAKKGNSGQKELHAFPLRGSVNQSITRSLLHTLSRRVTLCLVCGREDSNRVNYCIFLYNKINMPKLSKETKQRLQQVFQCGQFAIRWGFIPTILYLG